jgi:hypothetical protein
MSIRLFVIRHGPAQPVRTAPREVGGGVVWAFATFAINNRPRRAQVPCPARRRAAPVGNLQQARQKL